MEKLSINKAAVVIVSSRNDRSQPLEVKAGEIYDFSCAPEDHWVDFIHKTTAEGFDLKQLLSSLIKIKQLDFYEKLKLGEIKPIIANSQYFKLSAKIDVDGKEEAFLFAVGKNMKNVKIPYSGKLTFFANDALGFYGNNSGKIKVTVTRIA